MPALTDSDYHIILEALDYQLWAKGGKDHPVNAPIAAVRDYLRHHRLAQLSWARACARKAAPPLSSAKRIAAGDKIEAKAIGRLLFGKGP